MVGSLTISSIHLTAESADEKFENWSSLRKWRAGAACLFFHSRRIYHVNWHVQFIHHVPIVQEAQLLMLANPRDAFRGQSRSPNMVPFDMLGMVSY